MTIFESITDSVVGSLASTDHWAAIGGVAEGALVAGCVAVQGTANRQLKHPASAAECADPVCVILREPTNAVDGYVDGERVAGVRDGEVWCVCEEAMTPQHTVFVRHTTNGAGKLQVGALRTDDDTANAAACYGLRVVEASTGAGKVKVRVLLPCNAPILADFETRIAALEAV